MADSGKRRAGDDGARGAAYKKKKVSRDLKALDFLNIVPESMAISNPRHIYLHKLSLLTWQCAMQRLASAVRLTGFIEGQQWQMDGAKGRWVGQAQGQYH